jgi:tRNA nucleotidyltransferase (CCA-adding enzyme)
MACAIIWKMQDKIDLAETIQESLPRDVADFIKQAGTTAARDRQSLYLVGGVVRDLLLERHNLDLDLVVEGDAIKLAQEIAGWRKAKVTIHPRFGTATLQWSSRRADIATARAETYARPGALPSVRPGNIADDLHRRDFTINAIAIELNPGRFGNVIDPHKGRQDIAGKIIRVIHDKSFSDDATRIWRALRYEQRLGFHLERSTLALLKQGITYLNTISGDRIRHELEHVLKEETPEKALRRADELGVLAEIHPSLKCDDWLTETFAVARERCLPETFPQPLVYLALMCYRLGLDETEKVISYLRLPKGTTLMLRETMAIKGKIEELSMPGLAPSQIYGLIHGYGPTALTVNSIAAGSETAAEHIELYLNVLRYVKPALGGDDLIDMGMPPGPGVKEILHRLREARLDGKVTSKSAEEEMVRKLIGDSGSG